MWVAVLSVPNGLPTTSRPIFAASSLLVVLIKLNVYASSNVSNEVPDDFESCEVITAINGLLAFGHYMSKFLNVYITFRHWSILYIPSSPALGLLFFHSLVLCNEQKFNCFLPIVVTSMYYTTKCAKQIQ